MTEKTKIDDSHRPSWDETWMSIADVIAQKSRCSRAQIGAVIVSANQRICATGYNGPAAAWPHPGMCAGWCPRAQGLAPLDNTYDQCPSIHAEANALLYVDRSAVEGGTVYVTGVPCMQCAKLISNSGLSRVVCRIGAGDAHRKPELVFEYFKTTGIDCQIVSDRDTSDNSGSF